ncbi:MAG: hypothetical protein RLZZ403_1285 [Pseudomonadota bacterium]|jgi:hypothetical protein
MRLAGRDGRSEHPLESFWAGRTTAPEALRGICRGGYLCKCAGHIHAGEATPTPEPLPPAPQFRCEIPADAREPKACWLCGGTGAVEQHDGREDRYGQWIAAPVQAETCMNCQGTGVEKG